MTRPDLLACWRDTRAAALLRLFGVFALLAFLSACAGQAPRLDQSTEAHQYEQHAAHTYIVPGPPEDPWGPYISEASRRFDVPTRWIREVMHVESGGLQFHNGQLTTSNVGAMGLMQVMPETYDGLRGRYGLEEDAYDPHNNVLAGTAYIREMYDLYGAPGFLAAYNAGPNRLDDYLTRNRPLPDETRHYVAKIGPNIIGFFPERRSPAEDLAVNQIPIDIPPGPRYGRPAPTRAYAAAKSSHDPRHPTRHEEEVADNHRNGRRDERGRREEVEVAEARPLPTPPRVSGGHSGLILPPDEPRVQTAMATAHGGGFHLISPAAADTLPRGRGGPDSGSWAIQVGAYGNQSQARQAAASAHGQAHDAHTEVGTVKQPHATLYRARLTGMSRDAATRGVRETEPRAWRLHRVVAQRAILIL